jgi:TatD DNase family protein
VSNTAQFLADLRGEEPEELAKATSANFARLFSKAAL